MKSLKLISLALAMLFSVLTFGQDITITGTVTDETKTPLPGVSVTVKGTQKSTQTDFNGHYSIPAQKGNKLVFSYIGMIPQTIIIANSKVIDVRLKNNSAQLEEVVVVGYANSRREFQTGSVAAVSGNKKEKYSANHTKALQGQVAGIAVAETAPSIRIRGIRSFDTQSPLYDESKPNLVNSNPSLPTIPNNEDYENFVENQFDTPKNAPLSTFSIDVDNASYTNIRRFINNGQAVPKDAVRIEEMMNFFKYSYPQPKDNHPFSINTEYSNCPWNSKHQLLKIGLQGKNIPTENLPASNLVFLIDVSGSMSDPNKLPLLKQSMKILVNELRTEDKVSMVVYAGAAGMVLPPTSGDKKQTIINALDNLSAGGSTAGGAGIELAYRTALENFIKGGNNRVILATDGDFNVGTSSNKDMETLIEEKRKSGVFLTCLGYGMGNYKDSKMEILANKGNGNYAYIDNIQEANRFLGKEFKGSLFAIAKDVKIQIEFNPKHVQAYRLIGYENRKLRPEDFKNDAIDAGELGSGHTVTALYEIIPANVESDYSISDLKYTKTAVTANYSNDLATIKFRYKKPDENKSIEMIQTIENKSVGLAVASEDFKFSAAVAWFGLKLRDSKLVAVKDSSSILKLTKEGLSKDSEGYKAEFVRLVETVQ